MLTKIYDPTELSNLDTYQINDTLYKYKYSTDSINHKNYVFEPLPGQKKEVRQKLSRNKLLTVVKRIEVDNAV